MKALRSAGVILIIGAVLFAIGSFSPSIGVFWESDPESRLALIEASMGLWQMTHLFWVIGALVTVVGLGLVSYHLRSSQFALLAFLGFFTVALGVVIGVLHLYFRSVDPVAFVQRALPDWHYGAYVVLTFLGLAVYGLVYLRVGLPRWLGYVTLGGAALAFTGFLVFGEFWPPLSYYVLTLLAGVVLVRLS